MAEYTDRNGAKWLIVPAGKQWLGTLAPDSPRVYTVETPDWAAPSEAGVRARIDLWAAAHIGQVALVVTARPDNPWIWLILLALALSAEK
jgi:hypothetical protein